MSTDPVDPLIAEANRRAETHLRAHGRVRLARECAKIDPVVEQAEAEETFRGEVEWPEY